MPASTNKKPLKDFRITAIIEGISYLVLMFIAMPLKYFYDSPGMVKYTGWVHGILFVLYMILLLRVWIIYKWSFWKVTLAFIASLLPFATFIFDRRLKKELKD